MARRAALACALLVTMLAVSAVPAAAATRPVFRNACKLVTNDEIKALMGRSVKQRRSAGVMGCNWVTRLGRPGDVEQGGRNREEAFVDLYGFHRTVGQAKGTADFLTTEIECGLGWDPFLPSRRSPWDEAWLSGCGDVVFRLRRIVVKAHAFTNDVRIDSPAAQRRSTRLARIAAKRLRRYRCPRSFCP